MAHPTTGARTEREQVARKQASGSVLKAFDVIDALAESRGALSLQELSRAVGLPPSTVHRLARTLELRGYVENAEGRYRLTLKLFELGTAIVESIDVVAEARPYLEQLCEAVEETVNMAVRSGSSIVYVLKIESPRSVRLVSQIGAHAPLYCTAMGKVLLALAPPDARRRLLDTIELVPRAKNTITEPASLERELQRVERRGWAVDNEEFDFGLVCLAAPVFDRNAAAVAAISLSGPAQRVSRRRWPELAARVQDAASRISSRLGYGLRDAEAGAP